MAHCIDFWRKWKSEPNFCGLGGSTAKMYDEYLNFVDDFSKQYDIDPDIVYRNAPQSAIKPILRYRKNSEVRTRVTQAIAETLKSKHAITGKYVNEIVGLPTIPKKMMEEPKVIVAPISEPHREVINSNAIKDKIRLLTSALTSGQMNILSEVAKINQLDNEYEAMALIIKWAAEKLEINNEI